MESERMQTAKKFVAQYNTNDHELLQSILDDSMAYKFSPARSLDTMQDLDKAGYLRHRGLMSSIMSGYTLDVKQYIESESSKAVVIWSEGQPQFYEEFKDYDAFPKEQWDYIGEFVFMLTMNETGDKIVNVQEFVDSKGTDLRLVPLLYKAFENVQKKQRQQADGK